MKIRFINKLRQKIRHYKKKLTPNQAKMFTVLEFLIMFNLLAIPMHILTLPSIDFFFIELVEAQQTSLLLNLTGIPHSVSINHNYYTGQDMPVIILGARSLGIDKPCTGYRSVLALMALILATPGIILNKKLKGLLLLPVVYLVNTVRLYIVALVSISNPDLVEIVHIVLWREGLIAIVILLWYAWFSWSRKS